MCETADLACARARENEGGCYGLSIRIHNRSRRRTGRVHDHQGRDMDVGIAQPCTAAVHREGTKASPGPRKVAYVSCLSSTVSPV